MHKIMLILCIVLIAFPCCSYAESPDNGIQPETPVRSLDLSQYNIDDLLELQDMIREQLILKGYNPYYEIERNDKGENVARLQERLKELGYYFGNVSGKYDSSTAQAMKQFEKSNSLENDGKASREDQVVLFSDQAIPKAVPTPKPTFVPQEEDQTITIDPDEYGVLDYSAYYRNPENYRNMKVKLTGTVYQVLGNRSSGFRLLFTVGGENIYVSVSDPGYNIMENDRLVIYARMNGTYTYTSTMHKEITIPNAYADCIVLR